MRDNSDESDTPVPNNGCVEGVSPLFYEKLRERAPVTNARQPHTESVSPRMGVLLKRLNDLKKN